MPVSEKPLEHIIRAMEPISLEEMDHVKLMRRRDTKFVIAATQLPEILEQVKNNYRVLEINGERIHTYQTMYYDTPSFEMYQNHHNRRLNRYKVRMRKYVESELTFLEIKFKNNKRETIKKRIRPEQLNGGAISGEKSDLFLRTNSPYSSAMIGPALQNSFKRITIVHKTIPERITLDIDLNFTRIDGSLSRDLPAISVIEIKRDRDSASSDMATLLRNNKIQASGFSKYCMGTVLTNPEVKNNLFRKNIRILNKYDSSN